jgi:hypothetical protein
VCAGCEDFVPWTHRKDGLKRLVVGPILVDVVLEEIFCERDVGVGASVLNQPGICGSPMQVLELVQQNPVF